MKSIYIRNFIFVIALMINTSCDNKTTCADNHLYLLNSESSIPQIKIEADDTRESIITKFQSNFGKDICFEEIEFGLRLSEKIVRCYFTLYCPLKTSRFPKSSEVKILINQEKKVLINSDTIIEIDYLSGWIKRHYDIETSDEMNKKEIAILWNAFTPTEFMELTIFEIVTALSVKYDEIARKKYGKRFCKLNKEQTFFIKSNFPTKIILDIGVPPPPPPPRE